jgi:hypothetical protein
MGSNSEWHVHARAESGHAAWPSLKIWKLICDVLLLSERAQKQPGQAGFVMPIMEGGKPKVMLPEMLVGALLEMVVGSKLTPKGGLGKLLKAHAAEEVHIRTMC